MSPTGHFPPAPTRRLPQDVVDRPLVGFTRDYADGESVPRHSHARVQLLYATRGIMRLTTDAAGFVVPPGRALWLPGAVPHVTPVRGPGGRGGRFPRAGAAEAGQ